MITRTFKLCLNAGTGSAPYINVSQYDEGETWLFELYSETGERYIPTTGAIVGVKSDGHGIVNTGTVDSEGRVVITETEQMTASAGRAIYELSIDGLTHGTANFIVAVERKPTDDAVMSDSDLSLIQEAIDSAEVIVEVIGDSDPSEVIGEHVDAWLDNHPEATTTVEDGAITAPKINQSLWDKLLVNEEASGNPASFDDGADDVPVSSLKVALEPIQTGSGDPSPSNIRPIIASNGKNLLQVTGTTQTINGVTFTVNADGTVTANGTATAQSTFVVADFTGTNGTQYIVNGAPSASAFGTYFLSATLAADYGSGATFTGTGASNSVRIIVQSGQTVSNLVFKPMIRLASITDSSYQPYQGIMVDVTGKNLLNKNNVQNAYIDPSGVIYTNASWSTSQYVSINNNYKYTLSGLVDHPNTGVDNINQYDANYNLIGVKRVVAASGYPVQFDNGTKYVRFCWKKTDENTAMFAVGNDTTYVPYEGNSYPYTLGQSVYGGTVDLATGVLTVTHGIVDMGTLTWVYDSTRTCFYTVLAGMKTFASGDLATYVCDSYQTIAPAYSAGNEQNNTIWARVNETTFRVRDTSYTVAADFKAAVSGHQLVYELATPTTVQLTPQEVKTLLGYNNISSSGTVDVIYHADTKLYVDKMTAVDNNIIAPTEADFVATRNYTVNDLVIVNDTLYKVTANIASGSTITPNSNVQQTTLSALIKALS